MSLTGKVILITGASSGIGAATAILMAKLGANLILTARNNKLLESVADKCTEAGGTIPHLVLADLRSQTQVTNLYHSAIKLYNKLDVLINSAGVLETGSIETTDMEQYDRIFDVNVRALYQLTMHLVPHIIESKGTIINVSSVNGIRSFPGVLAYNMSKAAVDQMTKCLSLELASKGVRVNSVNPGVIKTDLHRRAGMSSDEYEQFLEKSRTTHAMGRVGEPEEVAKVILFLASEDASFITGANIPVDGGRSVMCPR